MRNGLILQDGTNIPMSQLPPELREALLNAKSFEMHTSDTNEWSVGPRASLNTYGVSLSLEVKKTNRQERYLKITR